MDTIDGSGIHLLELIDDVLDISRIEAGRMEFQGSDFDLVALIDGLSTMFQFSCEQKGLHWKVEWQKGGMEESRAGSPDRSGFPLRSNRPVQEEGKEGFDTLRTQPKEWKERPDARILVHGDEGKLRQVLINLLRNAEKFTESGEVRLRIRESINQRDGRTEEREEKEGGKVSHFTPHDSRFTFEVIDTGVGIPTEAQETIFEPFQQAEEGITKGGTGLGLAIAKKQVEIMGGQLAVESPPLNPPQIGGEIRGGSRFFFTIPLPRTTSDVLEQSSKWSAVRSLADGYHVNALIADDNKVNRDVLARILSNLGVEVTEVENGQQALEMLRADMRDIVFMDIRMPGMGGLEATRRIHEEFEVDRLKIVAISASVLRHQQEEYLEVGFDDFIGKPFRFERICECLANLLHVEYEYAAVETQLTAETQPTESLEVSNITLPEALFSRLQAAAEIYSVAELEACLDEIEQLGVDGQRLAVELRRLSQRYALDEILKILGEINYE